jgi:prolyl-tRNA editing enzyme YbaK/EbsC (Cys-tRNA(Pro) deacylase)
MSTSRTAEASVGSVARVAADAERLGIEIAIERLDSGTRTAEDAASACGCSLDQIVKSIVLRVAGTDRYLLFLTAGGHRVDIEKAAALAGGAVEKADAASVRTRTGFAIGGVSPIGQLAPIEAWMDTRLLDFEMVWAAAGSSNHVFSVDPRRLQAALDLVVADFTV